MMYVHPYIHYLRLSSLFLSQNSTHRRNGKSNLHNSRTSTKNAQENIQQFRPPATRNDPPAPSCSSSSSGCESERLFIIQCSNRSTPLFFCQFFLIEVDEFLNLGRPCGRQFPMYFAFLEDNEILILFELI
jgi:hypothetical protein